MVFYRWHESKTIHSSQYFLHEPATEKAARVQALDYLPFFHFLSLFFHPVTLQSWLRLTGHNDATIRGWCYVYDNENTKITFDFFPVVDGIQS
jgi:hypothetical protein